MDIIIAENTKQIKGKLFECVRAHDDDEAKRALEAIARRKGETLEGTVYQWAGCYYYAPVIKAAE